MCIGDTVDPVYHWYGTSLLTLRISVYSVHTHIFSLKAVTTQYHWMGEWSLPSGPRRSNLVILNRLTKGLHQGYHGNSVIKYEFQAVKPFWLLKGTWVKSNILGGDKTNDFTKTDRLSTVWIPCRILKSQ